MMKKKPQAGSSPVQKRKQARRRGRTTLLLLISLSVCAVAAGTSVTLLSSRSASAQRLKGTMVSAGIDQQGPGLSTDTIQQITALVADKESRTPAQQKIDSQLLQAIRESRGQKMASGVQLAPVNVGTDVSGDVKVDISADVSDDLITRFEGLGGEIIYPSFQYHTIRAQVSLSAVETIAAYPDVKFIQQAVPSMTSGSNATSADQLSTSNAALPGAEIIRTNPVFGGSSRRLSFTERAERVRAQLTKYLGKSGAGPMLAPVGTVNSQGDRAHRADDTRNMFGYSGAGIRIGVL
jgi:hypothetical protein